MAGVSRVLVAGAGGVIGPPLLRLLRTEHEVIGLTRSDAGAERARAAGATAMVADALDRDAVRRAVEQAQPEVVINQLTAIPKRIDPRRLPEAFEMTNRLRAEATRNLIEAAPAARHVAQSVAFAYVNDGGPLKSEDDPLHHDAPKAFRPNVAGIAALEEATLAAGGVVLRYGHFYGPGTIYARDGSSTEQIRARKLPIVGRGRGLFSFVHVDDAARATAQALHSEQSGVYNVVDDDPAPAAEWIAEIARLIGAPPPRRVPAVLARLAAGPWSVEWMDRLRGATNARAKAVLGWTPRFPVWRDGFRHELGSAA